MPNFYCMKSVDRDDQEDNVWINVEAIESVWQQGQHVYVAFIHKSYDDLTKFRYEDIEKAQNALQALISFCKQGA